MRLLALTMCVCVCFVHVRVCCVPSMCVFFSISPFLSARTTSTVFSIPNPFLTRHPSPVTRHPSYPGSPHGQHKERRRLREQGVTGSGAAAAAATSSLLDHYDDDLPDDPYFREEVQRMEAEGFVKGRQPAASDGDGDGADGADGDEGEGEGEGEGFKERKRRRNPKSKKKRDLIVRLCPCVYV